MTCDGGDGVNNYAFNEAVAKRRLRGSIIATVLIVLIAFAMQWLR